MLLHSKCEFPGQYYHLLSVRRDVESNYSAKVKTSYIGHSLYSFRIMAAVHLKEYFLTLISRI